VVTDGLRACRYPSHTMHMKRTTFMLDEQLLREAAALSGERTLTRTIERALQEMIRRLKARDLLNLAGSGIWQGELSAMRGDVTGVREESPVYRPRTRKPRSGR
jgi:hypothetical protein